MIKRMRAASRRLEVLYRLVGSTLAGRTRFFLSVIVMLAAKVLAAAVTYSVVGTDGIVQTRWVEVFGPIYPTRFNFLYVFTHWDSGWYLWIAKFGYTDMVVEDLGTFPIWYSFFPAFPLLIRATWFVTHDYVLSAVLSSFALGIAWIPVFQKLCERYMSKAEALSCTILAGFLPPVFLFTTVAYSESMFLLATLMAWYLYETRRPLLSSLFAALATASRIVGIFILIPILIDGLRRRDAKAIGWMTIPAGVFLAYAYYLFVKTGVWFAYVPATPGAASFFWGLPTIASTDFTFTFIVGFIALIGFLTFQTWDTDWRLALYASFSFIAILLLGFYPSYLRHFSFIFPTWTALRIRSFIGLALVAALFYAISILMWIQFLSWKWVG